MLTFCGQRQTGKTAAMINWLLKGAQISEYPGWSRVIICGTHHEVTQLQRRLRQRTAHLEGQGEWVHDLRKCVWSIIDMQDNKFSHNVELGIDNVELVLAHLLRTHPPAAVTLTGTGVHLPIPLP